MNFDYYDKSDNMTKNTNHEYHKNQKHQGSDN